MTKVLFLPEVEGYLGFKEVAMEYADQLFKDIQTNLPLKVKKDAPSSFKRNNQGLFYSSFPKNKNTTWYVFYSIYDVGGDTVYLIRYLGNNHVIAHHLLQ